MRGGSGVTSGTHATDTITIAIIATTVRDTSAMSGTYGTRTV